MPFWLYLYLIQSGLSFIVALSTQKWKFYVKYHSKILLCKFWLDIRDTPLTDTKGHGILYFYFDRKNSLTNGESLLSHSVWIQLR